MQDVFKPYNSGPKPGEERVIAVHLMEFAIKLWCQHCTSHILAPARTPEAGGYLVAAADASAQLGFQLLSMLVE